MAFESLTFVDIVALTINVFYISAVTSANKASNVINAVGNIRTSIHVITLIDMVASESISRVTSVASTSIVAIEIGA